MSATAPSLVIGQIGAQISWNLWVEHPDVGGETTLHHRPWTPDPNESGIPEQYPLDAALVEGAETYVYHPSVGDVIFFNTRNPHEITPGGSEINRGCRWVRLSGGCRTAI